MFFTKSTCALTSEGSRKHQPVSVALWFLGGFFYQVTECRHCGRNPLVLVPKDMGGYVEGRSGPMQGFEVVLPNLPGHRDGREEGKPHPCSYALLDGFDAGKLGDVSRADVLHRHHAIELGPVAAAMFGKQERLAGKIGRFNGAVRA